MDTPSLVIVGAPHFFSRTTLRPLGPNVTFTASARAFRPRSRPRRASSSYAIILDIAKGFLRLGGATFLGRAQCPRRTTTVVYGLRSHRPDLALTGRECQCHF